MSSTTTYSYSLKTDLSQLPSSTIYSSPLLQEESTSWLLKDLFFQNLFWKSMRQSIYKIFSFILFRGDIAPADTFAWVNSPEKEFSREEIICFLGRQGIYLDDESKKFLSKIEAYSFLKLVEVLLSIKSSFNRYLILTVFEDNGYENLLLLVCFQSESFEEVDQIMDEIYEMIEKSNLDFLSATEKFECQPSTGKTF